MDEVFVKINGKTHYLWRALGHEDEVLEVYVTKKRDRLSTLKFLKKALKNYGAPREIVTDRPRSYRAAMNQIGNANFQVTGRYLNNLCETSHQSFRRRERAMSRFRRMSNLQKFAATHALVHNHFNHQRNIERRPRFKPLRNAVLTEWRELLAA